MRVRDGSTVYIRPIRPQDGAALQRGLERMSPESRYRRFLVATGSLSPRMLRYFTDVDHRDHEALVALDRAGEGVGVARFVRSRERPDTAEVAIAVIDDWQGRGVGRALLEHLVERALDLGVERFTACCLVTNRDAIELLEELGPVVERSDGPLLELEIELDARGRERLHGALRHAAVGRLVPRAAGKRRSTHP